MQHVLLSDFFPLLFNNHSFVSPVQLENINLQQLARFASHSSHSLSCTRFILGTCHNENTSNTRQRHLDISGRMSPHTKLTSKSAFEQMFGHRASLLCPKQWECVSAAEGKSRRVCFMKSEETMRGKFHNYHPLDA